MSSIIHAATWKGSPTTAWSDRYQVAQIIHI